MQNELLEKQLKLVGNLGYSKIAAEKNKKEIYLTKNDERISKILNESEEVMANFTSKLREETKKYGMSKQTKRKQVRKRSSKPGPGIGTNC